MNVNQGAQGSSEGVNSLVTYNPSLFELTDEGGLMGPPASIGKQSRESTPQSGEKIFKNKRSPDLWFPDLICLIPICRFSLWQWAERMVKQYARLQLFAFKLTFNTFSPWSILCILMSWLSPPQVQHSTLSWTHPRLARTRQILWWDFLAKSDRMLQFCLINVKALTTQQFDIDCMKYESIWSFSHLVELDDNLLLPDQVIIKGWSTYQTLSLRKSCSLKMIVVNCFNMFLPKLQGPWKMHPKCFNAQEISEEKTINVGQLTTCPYAGSRIISPRPIDPRTLGPRTLDPSHPKSQGPVIRGPKVHRSLSPRTLGPEDIRSSVKGLKILGPRIPWILGPWILGPQLKDLRSWDLRYHGS